MRPIETNWTVITGAPSSGKTSVFAILDAMGMPTCPEAATICIQTRLGLGEALDDICNPQAQDRLQDEILRKAMDIQSAAIPTDPHFFDRSAIDSIAYCKLYGMKEERFIAASARYRFKHVFQLERLPLVQNGYRIENEETAKRLDRYLTEAYEQQGYNVLRVPVMTIGQRVEFILSMVEELEEAGTA